METKQPPKIPPSAWKDVHRWFLGAEIIWGLFVLWMGSSVGSNFGLVFFVPAGVLLFGGSWLIRGIVHFVRMHRRKMRPRFLQFAAEPILIVSCIALVAMDIPFHARFLLSRSAFTEFARSAEQERLVVDGRHVDLEVHNPAEPWTAGYPLRIETRVGLFQVRSAERFTGGSVRLELACDGCIFDTYGVAYSPNGAPPAVHDDTYTPLGGPWYHWRHDYDF